MIRKNIVLFVIFIICILSFSTIKLSAGNNQYSISYEKLDNLRNSLILSVNNSKIMYSDKQFYIDEIDMNVTAQAENGRTLVPLRFLIEILGGTVSWHQQDNSAMVSIGQNNLVIPMGESFFYMNGNKIDSGPPIKVINNRSYIPLRAISEALGYKAFYSQGLIIIGTNEKILDSESDKDFIGYLLNELEKQELNDEFWINNSRIKGVDILSDEAWVSYGKLYGYEKWDDEFGDYKDKLAKDIVFDYAAMNLELISHEEPCLKDVVRRDFSVKDVNCFSDSLRVSDKTQGVLIEVYECDSVAQAKRTMLVLTKPYSTVLARSQEKIGNISFGNSTGIIFVRNNIVISLKNDSQNDKPIDITEIAKEIDAQIISFLND